MALVRMKPPVGVSVGLGADDKLYYIDGQGFANVDSGSVTKLTAEGWVSAVPIAPEAPGNTFPVSATKTLTGGSRISAGDTIIGDISPLYKFFIPGQQFIGSGVAKDKSLNSADAALMAGLSDATAWSNPGYVTTAAGANGHLSIPLAKYRFDLATDSVIVSMRYKKAASAGTEYLFGCCDTGSTRGIYCSFRPLGGGVSKLRTVINASGGVFTSADSTATFGEAVATDHVLTLAIDGVTKSAFLYIDGTLSDTYSAAFTGSTTLVTAFAIGSNQGNAGATANAGQFSGIHMLAWTGGLPVNMGLIAQKLAAMPHAYLSNIDLQF